MNNDKIYNIGVLIGNAHMEHPKELIRGIYESSMNENVNVSMFLGTQGNVMGYIDHIFDSTEESYNYQFNVIYDYALLGNLDALIISYGTLCIFLEHEDKRQFFKKFEHIPYIVLEEYEENKKASFFISDNYGSMTEIVEHLINVHNYRKIVYLSGPLNNMDSNERRRAYIDTMKKYNLPVNEKMIAIGDYSTEIEPQVEKLLQDNPGVEAIVVANDEMAVGAYRVCKRHGLVIGRDIAITGYDDFEMARTMDPPLTTCNQDGFDMGYRALKQAVALCEEKEHAAFRLPAQFKRRGSCGCNFCVSTSGLTEEVLNAHKEKTDRRAYLVQYLLDRALWEQRTVSNVKYCRQIFTEMLAILSEDHEKVSENEAAKHFVDHLRLLFDKEHTKYINVPKLLDSLHDILKEALRESDSKSRDLWIFHITEATNQYLQSMVLFQKSEKVYDLFCKNWMAPVMIRQMMEHVSDETDFYRLAMEQIRLRGAKSAYFYMMSEPKKHLRGERWRCPMKMYLVAQYNGSEIICDPPSKRPYVTRKDGFVQLYEDERKHNYITFTLFVEETQYGVMICEINENEISEFYGLSLQVGTALRFLEMSKQEEDVKRKLYRTMKIMQDKNKVLSFVSSKDELTGIYNRRGFMEHAIEMTNNNEGLTAYMIFADLDHLKEINDRFGHTEGDFAIVSTADTLTRIVKDRGIVGRIGGDEFVAMVVSEEETYAQSLADTIRAEMNRINETSGKNYYVEFSVGIEPFICKEDCELAAILRQADEVLYEAKKTRRSTIVR